MSQFSLALHGGAGTILKELMTEEKEEKYLSALNEALSIGIYILRNKGKAIDAVEAVVISLENCPLFNAGKGSVFNHEGKHEMDASIMDGSDLNCGGVAGVRNIKNPISLARKVMHESEHILLAGKGAMEFAESLQTEMEDDEYFFDQFRFDQYQEALKTDRVQLDHTAGDGKKFGTVGAVAMDMEGNLAAATSTGGLTNKKFGRVGDSPIIGAGTYANNLTCAVSCTGVGELFIKEAVAFQIHSLMRDAGKSLKESCDIVVMDRLVKINGEGGLIAIDMDGNIELSFNSEGMYRAWANENRSEVKIYK